MGIALIIGGLAVYGVIVMVGLFTECVRKIPGAQRDEKFQRFANYFNPMWYLGLDKPVVRDYNMVERNQKPLGGYQVDDPYFTNWNNHGN